MTEKEKITILRAFLESNIITLHQIENWAQKNFMNSENREDYILDLCSAVTLGINETIHILKQNESSFQNPLILETSLGIIGNLYTTQNISLKKACYFVSKISIEAYNKTEYDLYGMHLDDTFYLADKGIYGNLNHTEKEFIKLTNTHKEPSTYFFKEFFSDLF